MINLFKEINRKVNGLIWSLASTGVIMLILAVLIAGTDYTLRIIMGLIVLLLAYTLLYAAYKVYTFKKEVKKHFKL